MLQPTGTWTTSLKLNMNAEWKYNITADSDIQIVMSWIESRCFGHILIAVHFSSKDHFTFKINYMYTDLSPSENVEEVPVIR